MSFMLVFDILRWIRTRLSILRFPTLLLILLLALSAGVVGLPTIFEGLLDVSTSDVWYMSWFAFLTAYVAMITSRLIRMFALERFGENLAPAHRELRLRDFLLWGLPAVPLVLEVASRPHALTAEDPPESLARLFSALVLGPLAAFATVWLAALLQHFLGDELTPEEDAAFQAGKMNYLLLSHAHWIFRDARKVKITPLPSLLPGRFHSRRTPGYWYTPSTGGPSSFREGHAVAAGLLLATLAVYLGGFFSINHALLWIYAAMLVGTLVILGACWGLIAAQPGARRFVVILLVALPIGIFVVTVILLRQVASRPPADIPIPPLAAVLLLLMVLGLGFSGLGFLLDASRIPVLGAFLVLSLAMNLAVPGEHFLPSLSKDDAEQAREASNLNCASCPAAESPDVAQQPASGQPPVFIAVSAAGGGIQAAAWTAKVLVELSRDAKIGPQFSSHLGLISSVSGGSVGTLFFVDSYSNGELAKTGVIEKAEASSLEYVGWGMVYPDFWRALCPICTSIFVDVSGEPTLDRAWTLESSWKFRLNHPGVRMRTWQSAGHIPAVILNATVAEEGLPLLLGPTDDALAIQDQDIYTLDSFFGKCDLYVQTATRLSATFPYISPMARLRPGECSGAKPYHVADGGYFNNNGVFGMLRWLRTKFLCKAPPPQGQKLILIQIRSFADDPPAPGPLFNALEQTIGPPLILNNVRGKGHDLTDATAIADFIALASSKGIEVTPLKFIFPALPDGGKPPLSWHLTSRDKEIVKNSWNDTQVQQNLCLLRNALSPAPACNH